MADPAVLTQNPFAALSFIAAPAVLTNAASVLAMSTSNRFLRASDRMRALAKRLSDEPSESEEAAGLAVQVDRVEKQAFFLLEGLKAAYVALGSFATASLVSLIGATTGAFPISRVYSQVTIGFALLAGLAGVTAMVWGSLRLFHATQLSMRNISDEAALIRRQRKAHCDGPRE